MKGNAMEKQLSLDLQVPVTYETYSGTCSCGHKWNYTRCSIVRDMRVPCPECGTIIMVGEVRVHL